MSLPGADTPASSVVISAASRRDISYLWLSQWYFSKLNRAVKNRHKVSDKDWKIVVPDADDDGLATKSRKIKKPLLTPRTSIHFSFPTYNVVICLDMCQASFNMTEVGVPFRVITEAMQEALYKIHEILDSENAPVSRVFVAVVAHRPELNATYNVWRGTLTADTDIDTLQELLNSKLNFVEEEAVSQQKHFQYKLGIGSVSFSFPCLKTYTAAIRDTLLSLPNAAGNRAMLLTSGTMKVNLPQVQEAFSRNMCPLYIFVERTTAVRSINVHQSIFELNALAHSTGGSLEVAEGREGIALMDNMFAAMARLIGDSFFCDSFWSPIESVGSRNPFDLLLPPVYVDSYRYPDNHNNRNRISEIVLQSYQIEGATIDHLVASRLLEGFRLVDLVSESLSVTPSAFWGASAGAGMPEPGPAHRKHSGIFAPPAESTLGSSGQPKNWSITVRMEKIISPMAIVAYELSFRLQRQHGGSSATKFSQLTQSNLTAADPLSLSLRGLRSSKAGNSSGAPNASSSNSPFIGGKHNLGAIQQQRIQLAGEINGAGGRPLHSLGESNSVAGNAEIQWTKGLINVDIRQLYHGARKLTREECIALAKDKAGPVSQSIFEMDKRMADVLCKLFCDSNGNSIPVVNRSTKERIESLAAESAFVGDGSNGDTRHVMRELTANADIIEKLAELDTVYSTHMIIRSELNGFALATLDNYVGPVIAPDTNKRRDNTFDDNDSDGDVGVQRNQDGRHHRPRRNSQAASTRGLSSAHGHENNFKSPLLNGVVQSKICTAIANHLPHSTIHQLDDLKWMCLLHSNIAESPITGNRAPLEPASNDEQPNGSVVSPNPASYLNSPGSRSNYNSVVIVEVVVKCSVFITIEVKIVAGYAGAHNKACSSLGRVVFDIIESFNFSLVLVKSDLSGLMMPPWYTIANSSGTLSLGQISTSLSQAVVVSKLSSQPHIIDGKSVIVPEIYSNCGASINFDYQNRVANGGMILRSLLQNSFIATTIHCKSKETLNLVIMELLLAKLDVGFNVVQYHVSVNNEGHYNVYVSLLAVGTLNIADWLDESTIQCNVHCVVDSTSSTVSTNMYSISVEYFWKRNSNDKQYMHQVFSEEVAAVYDRIEEFIRLLHNQDKAIFQMYSTIYPLIASLKLTGFGGSPVDRGIEVTPPGSSTPHSSSRLLCRVSAYDWSSLEKCSIACDIQFPGFYKEYAETAKAIDCDFTTISSQICSSENDFSGSAADNSSESLLTKSSSGTSLDQLSLKVPGHQHDVLNRSLVEKLHENVVAREASFLPVAVESAGTGINQRKYVMMIGSSLVFLALPDISVCEDTSFEFQSCILFSVSARIIHLPTKQFSFSDEFVASSPFLISKRPDRNSGSGNQLISIHDTSKLPLTDPLQCMEIVRKIIETLYLRTSVQVLFHSVNRMGPWKLHPDDVERALEQCNSRTARIDITSMVKKRIASSAIEMNKARSMGTFQRAFASTLGQIVSSIASGVAFIESTNASNSDDGLPALVHFIRFSLLHRCDEAAFNIEPLSSCAIKMAQEVVDFCYSRDNYKLVEWGEISILVEVRYLPPPVQVISSQLPMRRWSFTQSSKPSPSSSERGDNDRAPAEDLVEKLLARITKQLQLFSALDTLNSLQILLSSTRANFVPDAASLSLASQCLSLLQDVHRRELMYEFLGSCQATSLRQSTITNKSVSPWVGKTSGGPHSTRGVNHAHNISAATYSVANLDRNSLLILNLETELLSLQPGFSKFTCYEDAYNSVSQQWDIAASLKLLAPSSSSGNAVVGASSANSGVQLVPNSEVTGIISCWVLLTISNLQLSNKDRVENNQRGKQIVSPSALNTGSSLSDESPNRSLLTINVLCRMMESGNSVCVQWQPGQNQDTSLTTCFGGHLITQEILVQHLLCVLDTCWYRVNQRYLLETLSETHVASPYLLAPAAPKPVPISGGTTTTTSTSASHGASLGSGGGRIPPRNRPPIPAMNTLMQPKGLKPNVSSSPMPSAGTALAVSDSTQSKGTAPSSSVADSAVMNNGKSIEYGCFGCRRQGEVVCDVYHGARATLSHDSIVRTLEAQALSQFVVINNDRFFVSQDSLGNHYYMSFDPPTEKDSKTIRLALFGLSPPEPAMLLQLKSFLDPRLVEIGARAISASLLTKTNPSYFAHLNFIKQASPAKHLLVKFPLPTYVQDPFLYCSILKQLILLLPLFSPVVVPSFVNTTVNQSAQSTPPSQISGGAPGQTISGQASASIGSSTGGGHSEISNAQERKLNRSPAEFAHPAAYGYNLLRAKAARVDTNADTMLTPVPREDTSLESNEGERDAATMPYLRRPLKRNLHVVTTHDDLMTMAESGTSASKSLLPKPLYAGLVNSISPVFFGANSQENKQSTGSLFEESAVVWQQPEFSFLYNNLMIGNPVTSAGTVQGRASVGAATPNPSLQKTTAFANQKPVGFGLAMVEFFPAITENCNVIENASHEAMHQIDGILQAPKVPVFQTGCLSSLITDTNELMTFLKSDHQMSLRCIPLNEYSHKVISDMKHQGLGHGATQISGSATELSKKKSVAFPVTEENTGNVSYHSAPVGQFDYHNLSSMLKVPELQRSSSIASVSSSVSDVGSGPSSSLVQTSFDLHLRIFPTIPMQSKLLLDVCRVCMEQALAYYCAERLFSLTSVPGLDRQGSSTTLHSPKGIFAPRLGLSTFNGSSNVQRNSNSPELLSPVQRKLSRQFSGELVDTPPPGLEASLTVPLRAMIYCHDLQQKCKSFAKLNIGGGLERFHFPFVLPKKQSFELQQRIVEEFLRVFPNLRSSMVTCASDFVHLTDLGLNLQQAPLVQVRNQNQAQSISRLVEFELDTPNSAVTQNSNQVTPVLLTEPDCSYRRLSRWCDFGTDGYTDNYALLGAHILQSSPLSSINPEESESFSSPKRNGQSESSKDVGGLTSSEIRVLGDLIDTSTAVTAMPTWLRKRRYSLEIIINSRGIYIFGYNVQTSVFSHLKEIAQRLILPVVSAIDSIRIKELVTLNLADKLANLHSVLATSANIASLSGFEAKVTLGEREYIHSTLREILMSFSVKFCWEIRTILRLKYGANRRVQSLSDSDKLKCDVSYSLDSPDLTIPVSHWQCGVILEQVSIPIMQPTNVSDDDATSMVDLKNIVFNDIFSMIQNIARSNDCDIWCVGGLQPSKVFMSQMTPRSSVIFLTECEVVVVKGLCYLKIIYRAIQVDDLLTSLLLHRLRSSSANTTFKKLANSIRATVANSRAEFVARFSVMQSDELSLLSRLRTQSDVSTSNFGSEGSFNVSIVSSLARPSSAPIEEDKTFEGPGTIVQRKGLVPRERDVNIRAGCASCVPMNSPCGLMTYPTIRSIRQSIVRDLMLNMMKRLNFPHDAVKCNGVQALQQIRKCSKVASLDLCTFQETCTSVKYDDLGEGYDLRELGTAPLPTNAQMVEILNDRSPEICARYYRYASAHSSNELSNTIENPVPLPTAVVLVNQSRDKLDPSCNAVCGALTGTNEYCFQINLLKRPSEGDVTIVGYIPFDVVEPLPIGTKLGSSTTAGATRRLAVGFAIFYTMSSNPHQVKISSFICSDELAIQTARTLSTEDYSIVGITVSLVPKQIAHQGKQPVNAVHDALKVHISAMLRSAFMYYVDTLRWLSICSNVFAPKDIHAMDLSNAADSVLHQFVFAIHEAEIIHLQFLQNIAVMLPLFHGNSPALEFLLRSICSVWPSAVFLESLEKVDILIPGSLGSDYLFRIRISGTLQNASSFDLIQRKVYKRQFVHSSRGGEVPSLGQGLLPQSLPAEIIAKEQEEFINHVASLVLKSIVSLV